MIIAVDFDGTLVEHKYPDIGNPVPGAFFWLKKFQEMGAKLILWTMRSDSDKAGPVLSDAVAFCENQGVTFFGVNENPLQSWSTSPKVYAHVYIDDAAFGCPLVESKAVGGRPMVDWNEVGPEVCSLLELENTK